MQSSDQPALARQPARRRILLGAIIAGIAVVAVAVLAATDVLGSRSLAATGGWVQPDPAVTVTRTGGRPVRHRRCRVLRRDV